MSSPKQNFFHTPKLKMPNWGLSSALFLGLMMRLPGLNGSFWLDEAAQILESTRGWSQQFEIIPDFQPPLFHLWLKILSLFGTNEWWLRLGGSVIPGLISIGFVYAIANRWWGRRAGLVAALVLATNPFHIFFSQELRPYAFPAMVVCASWWWIICRAQASRQSWWLGWVGLSLAGLYSSYLYPFAFMSQLIYLGWLHRQDLKPLLLSVVAIGLGGLPWLPIFFQQLNAGGAVRVNLPGWSEVVSPPPLKALFLVPIKFLYGLLDFEPTIWFLGPGLLMGLVVMVILIQNQKHWLSRGQQLSKQLLSKTPWSSLVTISLWLWLPLLLSWLVSYWIPVLQPKRVLFLLPAVCLGLAYLGGQLPKAKKWQAGLVGLVILTQVLSFGEYLRTPTLQRENWRSLHQTIINKYPADRSIAVFVFDEPFAPWRWYDDGTYPTLSLGMGKLSVNQIPDLSDHLKPINQYQFVLVFDYLRDLSDPQDQTLRTVEAFGYNPVDILDMPNIGFVRVYAKADSVVSWSVGSR